MRAQDEPAGVVVEDGRAAVALPPRALAPGSSIIPFSRPFARMKAQLRLCTWCIRSAIGWEKLGEKKTKKNEMRVVKTSRRALPRTARSGATRTGDICYSRTEEEKKG